MYKKPTPKGISLHQELQILEGQRLRAVRRSADVRVLGKINSQIADVNMAIANCSGISRQASIHHILGAKPWQ